MKVKFINPCLSSTLIVLLLIFFLASSCENMKEDPVYVGTWQFTEQITTDGLVINTVRTLKLGKKTYEETYLVERESTGLISEIIGTRGNLIFTHTGLVFQLKELGTCDRDDLDKCTGDVLWYGDGSNYWNTNILFFEPLVPGEYQADETTLRLIRDLNTDGDNLDAGEDIVFERI